MPKLKRLAFFPFTAFLLLNAAGCFMLAAGAAGGAGTAIWLSDKLTEEFNSGYERTVKAAESALISMSLKIKKESREADITQLRSEYTDGREIWIDVRRISDYSTKVEVRVGAVKPNKEAASKILQKIGQLI